MKPEELKPDRPYRLKLRRLMSRTRLAALAAAQGAAGVLAETKQMEDLDSLIFDILEKSLPRAAELARHEYEKNPSKCEDCGSFGLHYMLKKDVWELTVETSPARLLCLPCVERRLGRKLVVADLSDAPINGPIKHFHERGR